MIVQIGSIVRDASEYLNRYFTQVQELQRALFARGDSVQVAIAEGDSVDDTWDMLRMHQALEEYVHVTPPRLIKYDLAGQKFGSVNVPQRWANIARTWNMLLDEIQNEPFDVFIYVEADLIWQPETMLALIADLAYVDAVAPMSMHQSGYFYDTWGHRAGGLNFSNNPPYHPRLPDVKPGQLMQLDSAGSCKVMRAKVARQCRLAESDAMMGHDIYKNGFSLWLDPEQKVIHP